MLQNPQRYANSNLVSREGGLCMKGAIYENNGKGARWMVRFGNLTKRFDEYKAAERFLNGLRFKSDEGSFDPRDYRKDNPLGFANLATKWLDIQYSRGLKCPNSKKLHISIGCNHFQNQNIKLIGYGELEDFLTGMNPAWSEKYRANIMSTVTQFLKWVAKREKFYTLPDEIPTITNPTMKMRKTVDKGTQWDILEEIKRLTWDKNPKIYIACLWLSTYVELRPAELLEVKEGDIDLSLELINIKHAKTGDESGKKIYLLDEDVALIKSFPPALPHLYFFRHPKSRKGLQGHLVGARFGKRILYKWWDAACRDLGIQGVPIYPGTRHSSVTALGQHFSPEEVMAGSGHKTSKAFMRYFSIAAESKKQVSLVARKGDQKVINIFTLAEKTNSLKS